MQQKKILLLPYKGEKGEHLIKSMKRRTSLLLPPEIKTPVFYTGQKVSTCFTVRDQSKLDHQTAWHTTQIAIMDHAEKTILVGVALEFQNEQKTITVEF